MNTTIDPDSLWKDIIEEFFTDFLLFFAKDLCKHIDFAKKTEFLEKELTQLFPVSESGKRHVDKLAKVYLKDGEEKWILIHVDVQGYWEEQFSERMFEYFYRVYDKYRKKIFAIAIFSDDNTNYKPQSFSYSFYGTRLQYDYNTYKILEQNENLLKQSDNPFAMVILAALYAIKGKKDVNARFGFKINLLRLLLSEKWSKDKINMLFLFIDGIMKLPQDLARKFDTELNILTKKGESGMALTWENSQTYQIRLLKATEEAAEKAAEKATEKAVKETTEKVTKETTEKVTKETTEKVTKEHLIKMARILLCKKFKLDSLPNEIDQKIDKAKISQLEDIRDNIFDIESLEEVTKYME